MIRADEARANVLNYEESVNAAILKQVDELLAIMNDSIVFHSTNGFHSVIFAPYDKSRFQGTHAFKLAQETFTKKFEEYGYKVSENNYEKNSLIVEW